MAQDKEGNQDTLERPVDRFGQVPGTVANKALKARKLRDPCKRPEMRGMKMCRKNAAKEVKPRRADMDDIYGPR